MKILTLIALGIISTQLFAYESDEIAYLLNQEMENLIKAAPKAKVWASGSLPSLDQRSGPSPTQMEGIENLEQRFFSDEVSFQAARSMEVEPEETPKSPRKTRLKANNDGTVSEMD